jgi:hypothetical protein
MACRPKLVHHAMRGQQTSRVSRKYLGVMRRMGPASLGGSHKPRVRGQKTTQSVGSGPHLWMVM